MKYYVKEEGKLRTPWDKFYKSAVLIREQPNWGQPPAILEFGVNYFILKLEALKLKTLWSCEGHPDGFYIVFKAPYRIARKISFASQNYATLSISNITKDRIKHVPEVTSKITSRRNLCWNFKLNPCSSYEQRNGFLRELSVEWEKHL